MQNAEFLSMSYNVIVEKSFDFAVRIVNLHKYLNREHKEFVLAKQLLRSGTSIGANVSEEQRGQSKADFTAKMSIALKEASETNYWLRLLHSTDHLSEQGFSSIISDCRELEKMLTAIIKTTNELG